MTDSPEADEIAALETREPGIVIKKVPAGYAVVLDGGYYGIGSTVEAAYDYARNYRITDMWKALA